MNVIQSVEAYNNTIAALSGDGQWLTVRTLKAPEKIIARAIGYTLVDTVTDLSGDYPEHTITFRKS